MTVQRPLPDVRPSPLNSLPRAVVGTRAQPPSNATLVSRVEITGTLGVFVVVLDAPLGPYRPGQYVSLGVGRGGEIVQRPYSIVSLDRTATRVELFIRRLPDGRLSNLVWTLSVGARVRVGPPRGLFLLDREDSRPRLMIGTGTGLAPLLAMLADGADRHDATPSLLVHGVAYFAELAFGGRIAKWVAAGLPVTYLPTVSRPAERRNAGWTGATGRAEVQVAALLDEQPAWRSGTAYLCGNPDMIESCRRVLLDAGLAAADIRAEQFHSPVAPPTA